jgi:hypothetical protein
MLKLSAIRAILSTPRDTLINGSVNLIISMRHLADEDYSRDASCAINSISMFLFHEIWFMFMVLLQLYRGSQLYWWMKPEYPEKTTDLP